MKTEIIKTGDGSLTLYVPELDEHYHSTFGAVQESLHVFILSGLNVLAGAEKKTINILEIGFGTGLNALLTYFEKASGCSVNYCSIEAFPLKNEIIKKLNYTDFIKNESSEVIFSKIHNAPWNERIQISEEFFLLKIHGKIQQLELAENEYELVYFDAFGPDVQPEMWSKDIFEKIGKATRSGGILITYSAKGIVRRNLIAAGFETEKIPGPPGKREITKAIKRRFT